MDSKPTYGESVSNAFRSRVRSLAAANEKEAPDFDAVETETPAEPETGTVPKESWKKDEILDWLVDNEVITAEQRAEVEDQTKAELIENFVDAEG